MAESISLIRDAVMRHLNETCSINPSLKLQKCLPSAHTEKTNAEKTEFLESITDIGPCEGYLLAFNRWLTLSQETAQFNGAAYRLKNRLLLGLNGNGVLETGCTLTPNYGMPYIPGSTVKGAVRSFARTMLFEEERQEVDQLLGSDDAQSSGLVTFYDAWWIPEKKSLQHHNKPFALDIVNSHHQEYYNGKVERPSDFDSPIPNHLLAVQGSFLFVLAGPPEVTQLCQDLLELALARRGIGAKKSSGYGLMEINLSLTADLQKKVKEIKKEKAASSMTASKKALLELTEKLEQQQSENTPDSSGKLRDLLKQSIENALCWPQEDIESLQSFAQECIRYWDPKRKNKKLKAQLQHLNGISSERQEASALANNQT